MKDSKEISEKCSKCGKETSFPLDIKPENRLCVDCMNKFMENQSDPIDSFDYDQGYNIDEVYDQ